MECLSVQTFVLGIRDGEIQRALRLASPKALTSALATYKATKKPPRGYTKV